MNELENTGERISGKNFESKSEYILFLKHLFAYEFAQKNISEHSAILEIGCGEGYGTNLLSKKFMITGLDIYEQVINHASEKYGSATCKFLLFNGEKIPYPANTFDAVVSFQVIEHIKDDINFVSEVFRVLKRKGVFLITTPNRHYRLKPGQKPWNRFHEREYDSQDFFNVLNSKFCDITICGIRGTDEVQNIEIDRVQSSFLHKFDTFSIRRFVPFPLKKSLNKFIKKMSLRPTTNVDKKFIRKFTSNDFYIINNNLTESLDLLGICKK